MTAIGRCLAVSCRVVIIMLYWIMTHKYIVLSRTIVQFITSLEKDTDKITEISNEFDTDMSRCFKEEEDLTYEKSKPNPEG